MGTYKQFEYKIRQFEIVPPTDSRYEPIMPEVILDGMGKEGWELVSATFHPYDINENVLFEEGKETIYKRNPQWLVSIFKREKLDKEKKQNG